MEEQEIRKVLVAGASGQRGKKVLEFLKNRDFLVFGADRILNGQSIEGIVRFFRLNLRHRDSICLMFEVCKPDALVYCAVSRQNMENYSTYLGILKMAIEFGVKRVAIVTDNVPTVVAPDSLLKVEEIAIIGATKVLATEHGFRYQVVSQKDNLLKEIKRFLKEK